MPVENERITRSSANGVENSLKDIKEQLENMNKKIAKIEEKITTQARTMNKLEDIIELNRIMSEHIKTLQADNIQLKTRVLNLEKETEKKIYKERRNQIEIIGIPQNANEKIEELLIKLTTEAKVEVERKDIEKAFRIKSKAGKEPPIIIEFKEARMRDNVIKELKRLKPKTDILRMEPKGRNIYINESLSPKTKNILYRVKKAAYENKWNKVWTYAGIVHLKMEREGVQIKIETIEELETLLK